MKIPFVDLDAQYQSIKKEVLTSIEEVLDSKKFVMGDYCNEFRDSFLKVHGGEYGVCCSNGTSAITVALRSLNIGPGDEVITSNNTFFATVEAIVEVGATPVLVDCKRDTYQIDESQITNKITDKTKAIIAVHLYGNPCEIETIANIAKENNLFLVEDCAQAHLSKYNDKAIGTFGDMATFSFYPGKNLGAYGDAGFILCSTKELETKASMLVNHGRTDKYVHEMMAGNYRMDGIQAAILSVKTKYISEWTDKRISIAKKYDEFFDTHNIKRMHRVDNVKAVYHLYVIEIDNRDALMDKLREKGVSVGIHYPVPMNQQPACKGYITEDKYQVSEDVATKLVSLPIYPELTDEQFNYITDSITEILGL